MDDYFGEKGIQKEENKHTQSYNWQSAVWRAGLLTGKECLLHRDKF